MVGQERRPRILEVKGHWLNFRPLGNRNNKEVEIEGINRDDWHAYTWCRRPFARSTSSTRRRLRAVLLRLEPHETDAR